MSRRAVPRQVLANTRLISHAVEATAGAVPLAGDPDGHLGADGGGNGALTPLVLLVGLDQDGRRVELLHHVSQLNPMLVAQPTVDGSPARRIEFDLPGSSTE